jgi:phage terminase small subunit
MSEITDKQKKFADEYLIDLNGARAYRTAYPTCVNDKSAFVSSSRLLKNVKVAAYLEQRMKDRERRTEITQDAVLKELAAVAFSKATDYAKVVEKQMVYVTDEGVRIPLTDDNGNPIMTTDVEFTLSDQLTPEQIKAISGIKKGKFGLEVATNDKIRALELIGRHLGMFKDKIEITGEVNNPFQGLSTEELKRVITDE